MVVSPATLAEYMNIDQLVLLLTFLYQDKTIFAYTVLSKSEYRVCACANPRCLKAQKKYPKCYVP